MDVVEVDREDRAIDHRHTVTAALTVTATVTVAVVVISGRIGSIGAAVVIVAVEVVAQLLSKSHQLLSTETVAHIRPATLVFPNMVKIMKQIFIMSILNGNTHRCRIHIKDIFNHKQQVTFRQICGMSKIDMCN